MSEHSPGPWSVSGRTIRDLENRQIGSACEWDTRPDAEYQHGVVASNARIMSAAPEMLELLRVVSDDACETACSPECPHSRARALLARIDGET